MKTHRRRLLDFGQFVDPLAEAPSRKAQLEHAAVPQPNGPSGEQSAQDAVADGDAYAIPTKVAREPLKARSKQMSVYLEPEMYDALRQIAFDERTKMHPLVIEGITWIIAQRKRSSRE